MSSFYRGRGRGHGGRNNRNSHGGRNNNTRSNKSGGTSTTNRALEFKFVPQTNNRGNYATFDTTREAIQAHVQEKFTNGYDVAMSLRDGQLIDFNKDKPKREISKIKDKEKAAIEQAGFDIQYQEEMRLWLDRVNNVKEGMRKCCPLIKNTYCTRSMQQRLEEHPDYASKIQDDPIAMLEAIKTLTQDPVRAQYPFVSMTNSLVNFLNIQQHENENLLDYVKRFKQLRDIMKSQLGSHFLDHFVEHLPLYVEETDTDKKQEMKNNALEPFLAYQLLKSSDQTKYGSLLSKLQSQYSLGLDQYPKTLNAAVDALSNHKYDPKFYEKLTKNREKARAEKKSENSSRNNSNEGTGSSNVSFAQQGKGPICYCCGTKGHTPKTCNKVNTIPKDQWWINKAVQNYTENKSQSDQNDNASTNTAATSRRSEQQDQDQEDSDRETTGNSWSGY